jgi:hypothetical protein
MSEVNEITKTQAVGEIKSFHPTIRFEAGNHPVTERKYEDIDTRLHNGDLRAHIWNPEVSQRVRESPQDVITIDGLVPLVDWSGKSGPQDLAYTRKLTIWRNLPDRPKELKDEGKVLVVVGDISPSFSGNLSQGYDKADDQVNIGSIESYMNYLLQQEAESSIPRLLNEAGVFAATPVAYLLAMSLHRTFQGRMTRRDLLKTIGKGIAAIGLTSTGRIASIRIPEYKIGNSQNRNEHDFWQGVNRVTGKYFFGSEWTKARTAILAAKSEDALIHIGKSDGTASLIMGSAHAADAMRTIYDRDHRNEAINQYASNLLKVVDLAFEGNSSLPKSLVNSVKKNLLHVIAQVDLIKVTDSSDSDHVQDMRSFIENNVKFQETFQSPQVEEALGGLN